MLKWKSRDISEKGGKPLLSLHQNNISHVLQFGFPEFQWSHFYIPEDVSSPRQTATEKNFLITISVSLKIVVPASWLSVSIQQLEEKGGDLLSKKYNNSMYKIITRYFPEIKWQIWLFNARPLPGNYWASTANQRKYFDWLGRELGITSLDEWCTMRPSQILDSAGYSLLTYHKRSLFTALKAAYPHHKFHRFLFSPMTPSYWARRKNQIEYCNWLFKHKKWTKMEDWYRLTTRDLIDNSGAGLLAIHNESLKSLLESVFPNHNWQFWLLVRAPTGYWNDKKEAKKWLAWAGEELEVKDTSDWYSVPTKALNLLYGYTILGKHGGFVGMLKYILGDEWKQAGAYRGEKLLKGQKLIFRLLKCVLGDEEIMINAFLDFLKYEESGQKMELDFYLKKSQVAVEYHGEVRKKKRDI